MTVKITDESNVGTYLGFAAKIRTGRSNMGISQEDIAGECGVSSITVDAWEHGRTLPKGQELETLAGIFGVEASKLVG